MAEQIEIFKAAYSPEGWFVSCRIATKGVAFYYHGGHLDPKSRFQTEEEAQQAARLCNIAFEAGVSLAQRNMRRALGIDTE